MNSINEVDVIKQKSKEEEEEALIKKRRQEASDAAYKDKLGALNDAAQKISDEAIKKLREET